MFKALVKKKLDEFRANHVTGMFTFLFAISLLSLLRVWIDTPLAHVLSFLPMFLMSLFLGTICASMAFNGDVANQAGRFLEYLPLQRSAFWLANYLCGLAVLCLAAASLFSLDVLFFPLGLGTAEALQETRPYRQFVYLLPNGIAAAVSCASIVIWMYSLAVFPVAYAGAKDAQPNVATGAGALLGVLTILAPVAPAIFIGQLNILPSGLALFPVLLTSAALYSAGSYVLYSRVPRHFSPTKHAILGLGLFLAISAVLFGQLYVKYLAWRVLDPSLVAEVTRVELPHLVGQPDLILANVESFRSREHFVAIDVEQGTYHDLGRGLKHVSAQESNGGRLYFVHAPNRLFHPASAEKFLISVLPDGQDRQAFRMPGAQRYDSDRVQWLPDKGLLVYSGRLNGRDYSLCVADSGGNLLRHFDIQGYSDFLAGPTGRALAIAPAETNSGTDSSNTPGQDQPYMLIDVASGSIQRFGLPGSAVYFAKDLRRVLCLRKRVQDGRQYQSYVLVELPSLEERVILSEDEFPPQAITEQVEPASRPAISVGGGATIPFLRVNDSFDTLLWRKQRTEGDDFHYSIVLINLDTAQQQVAVPESNTPALPVVIAKDAEQELVVIDDFIAEDAGFTYEIGPRRYLFDVQDQQSILVADGSIPFDGSEEGEQQTRLGLSSPSGRRALRFENVWHPRAGNSYPRLKFSAIDVFENGVPTRLYTGQRRLSGALWLDNERIVFYEESAIYLLSSAGGAPRRVFPPQGEEAAN